MKKENCEYYNWESIAAEICKQLVYKDLCEKICEKECVYRIEPYDEENNQCS